MQTSNGQSKQRAAYKLRVGALKADRWLEGLRLVRGKPAGLWIKMLTVCEYSKISKIRVQSRRASGAVHGPGRRVRRFKTSNTLRL